MEGIDSTKTGNYTTKVKEELLYQINWDKVKTFEDFILLAKSGVITTTTITKTNLDGSHKEVKKFFKTDGMKVMVFDAKTE